MASISITRTELLDMLRKAKAKADREDAKNAAAHKKDEAKALEKFRKELRFALDLDYETLKKNGYANGYQHPLQLKQPECPSRKAYWIEVAIRQVNADSRKGGRLNLKEQHDWYKAAFWLPESERPKQSVCDVAND